MAPLTPRKKDMKSPKERNWPLIGFFSILWISFVVGVLTLIGIISEAVFSIILTVLLCGPLLVIAIWCMVDLTIDAFKGEI